MPIKNNNNNNNNNNSEKNNKKQKLTNSHYTREKTYQAFISCCQLIDLKRTLLLNAIKIFFKNYNNYYLQFFKTYGDRSVYQKYVFIQSKLPYIRQVWVCFRRFIYIVNTKSYVLFWSHKMKIKLPLTAKGKRVTAMILRCIRITASVLKKKPKKGKLGV